VIASKNVSLLAKGKNDLDSYKDQTRFYFAHLIGITWFDLLNSRKICQKTLKEDLKVHLINYQQTDLQFYALVDHNSLNTCISPSEAFAFFKKHGFTIVSMKK